MSSRLEAIREKREARKEKLRADFDEQRAIDLEAVDDLEIEHGDNAIASVDIPYRPGEPTLVCVRAPNVAEMKRYRARVKPRKGGEVAAVEAAEELARSVMVYPGPEMRETLTQRIPMLEANAGVKALQLAGAISEDEGKY